MAGHRLVFCVDVQPPLASLTHAAMIHSVGRAQGHEEGHALGAQAGFDVSVCTALCLASAQVADLVWCRDVGSEVGYYYGAATTWLALADRHPGLVSERCVVSVSGVAKEHGKQTRHAVSDTLTCMVTHWACEEPAAGRRRCRRPHSG